MKGSQPACQGVPPHCWQELAGRPWLGGSLLAPNLHRYTRALSFQIRFPEFLRTPPPTQAEATPAWCRARTLYPVTHPE